MNRVPSAYNNQQKSVKKTRKRRQQQGGGLGFSHLPCKEHERVQYKPNKPVCHLWNTPQCGYGCGTCAGSDGCMNQPYGQVGCNANTHTSDVIAAMSSSMGAPICGLDLDLSLDQGMLEAEQQGAGRRRNQRGGGCSYCMREVKGQRHMPQLWYSQQCGSGLLGDCAGSGTRFGCGCGGGGCQDCTYYNNMAKNYRHMLTGALYPFCEEK